MIKVDAARYEAGMIALAAVTGKVLDVVIKRAYWEALEDVPIETLVQAMKAGMTSCEYFPSAAELRRLCDDVEPFTLTEAVPALASGIEPEVYMGTAGPPDSGPYYWCVTCRDSGFEHFLCAPENRCGSFELCRKRVALGNWKSVV